MKLGRTAAVIIFTILGGSVEYSAFGNRDQFHASTISFGFGLPGESFLYGTTDTDFVRFFTENGHINLFDILM